MEVLGREKDVVVNYLSRPNELSDEYDCLILPGTKNVIEDAAWLGRAGWKNKIRQYANVRSVLGICGGYQLLGERIMDPYGVESDQNEVRGLGLLPVETLLKGKNHSFNFPLETRNPKLIFLFHLKPETLLIPNLPLLFHDNLPFLFTNRLNRQP